MNCHEFENAWQSRLDGSATVPLDERLKRHASDCDTCGVRFEGYARLERALASWGPAPCTSPELADRLVDHLERASARPVLRMPQVSRLAWVSVAGVAAAVLAAAVALWNPAKVDPEPVPRQELPLLAIAEARTPARPLTDSVADATSATLDLAEFTSAPAARLGWLFLTSATSPLIAAPPPPEVAPEAGGELLKTVGQKVATRVRPIGGQTRRAFGFLIPSTEIPPSRSVHRSDRDA